MTTPGVSRTSSDRHSRILADSEIVSLLLNNEIIISPLVRPEQIGPTVDLRLGTEFQVRRMDSLTNVDPIYFRKLFENRPDEILQYYDTVKRVEPGEPFVLHPSHLTLGSTMEYISLPSHIGGHLEGRSSWAREGLHIHSTAAFIHPGHRGIIVLELHNAGTHPISLYPGMRVAQLQLYELEVPNQRPYGTTDAKYIDTVSTGHGRPWEEWEFEVLAREVFKKKTEESNA